MPLTPPFWPPLRGPGVAPGPAGKSLAGGGQPARPAGIGDGGLQQRLIPRDPRADPRSRPHMDHVAALLNSLLRGEELVQTDQSEWKIVPDDGDVRVITEPSDSASQSDRGKLLVFNSSIPVALALPHVEDLEDQWLVELMNLGSGTVRITPDVGTINGERFVELPQASNMRIYLGAATYWASYTIPGDVLWDFVV